MHDPLLQEKNVWEYGWILVLSAWGGITSYVRRVRLYGHVFSLMDLAAEIVISGFVGAIVAMLCLAQHLDELYTGAIVGITSHMGSRALWLLEDQLRKRFLTNANPDASIDGRDGKE